MKKLHHGTTLLFQSRLADAEAVFADGMQETLTSDAVPGEHDLRGAFALNYALSSVIKGVASMENDQLDECRERLIEAQRLASEGDAWIGQAVVCGICTVNDLCLVIVLFGWPANILPCCSCSSAPSRFFSMLT
jgi:hypothetical protein